MLYNNLIYLIKVKIKRKRLFSHCTTCFQVLCPDLEALELLTAHICTCASSCLCLSPQVSWSKPSQGWCLFLRTQSCSLPLSSNSHTGKAERNSSSGEHNQSPPDCLSFPKDINQGRHRLSTPGFWGIWNQQLGLLVHSPEPSPILWGTRGALPQEKEV